MRVTNKQNLPEAIYNMLSKQRYNKGEKHTDYSVTTLKSPPRIVQLERRHWGELECDAIDNLWSMFGNIAHNLLEEHSNEEALSEERLYLDILGRTVSGQIDHYHDGKITDYKITSAWTLVYGSRIKEWEEQLNMYAYLFTKHDYSVRQIEIVAILRDWDKNKALQSGDYPKSPIQIIPITLWSTEEQEEYILNRVQKQIDNEQLSDEELDWCTAEDTWEQPSKYAVMKEGAKRATKLFDSQEDAEAYLTDTGGYEIVKRCGKRTRCADYCNVSQFCNQYKDYLNEQEP